MPAKEIRLIYSKEEIKKMSERKEAIIVKYITLGSDNITIEIDTDRAPKEALE